MPRSELMTVQSHSNYHMVEQVNLIIESGSRMDSISWPAKKSKKLSPAPPKIVSYLHLSGFWLIILVGNEMRGLILEYTNDVSKDEQWAGNIYLAMFVRWGTTFWWTITSISCMSSLTSKTVQKLAVMDNCVWLPSADGVRHELQRAWHCQSRLDIPINH